MMVAHAQMIQRLWARVILAFGDLHAHSEVAAAFAETAFALTQFFAQNPRCTDTIGRRIITFAGLCDESSRVTRESEPVSAAVKTEVKPIIIETDIM